MKKFLSFLLVSMLFVLPVKADDVLVTENKDENLVEVQTIEADESVRYDKHVDGSTVLLGNDVKYSGESNGILFGAGNDVLSSGEGEYQILAGYNVTLEGTALKDAFLFGNIVNVNSTVKRDILICGSTVKLSGNFDRNVTIYASKVTLENVNVAGNVKIKASDIFIEKNVKIDGELNYEYTNTVSKDDTALYKNEVATKMTVASNVTNHIKSRAISYGAMLLVFVILALAVPGSFKNVADKKIEFFDIISYIGYALVFIILVPVLALMLIMLSIGVPLALIVFGLYILVIYLSYAYFGYYIGKQIYKSSGKEDNVLLEGLIGITILYLLSLIPQVGPFITVLSYLCGIGVIIFKFKK